MSKTKLGLVSLITTLSALALLAPSAGALIKYQWKVGGALLKEAETREFLVTSDGRTFDLNGTVAGVGVLLLSNVVEVEKGAKIIGGKPGTNEETVIFRNVTADKPAGCLVESEGSAAGVVKTNPLKTVIVESEETHQPLILFEPKNVGSPFVSLLLLKNGAETCAFAGVLANVAGNILAEPLPQLQELLTQHLIFEAKTKEFLLNPGGGIIETAGLLFGGNIATLTGLVLVLLHTHELFGAF
jgi:hypothetical protein